MKIISIGLLIDTNQNKSEGSLLVLQNLSQLIHCSGYIINKIQNYISLDSSNRIKFAFTNDSAFTQEEYKVGMPFSIIKMEDKVSESMINGLGYIVCFKNGWCALFSDEEVVKTRKLNHYSTIKYFYLK